MTHVLKTPPKRLVGCELIALAARSEQDFVAVCEQRYHDRLDAAVEAALARKAQIIMLTGPSAAGKTTTAHKLAERIAARGLRSAVMSLDDFFVGEGRYPKQPDGSDDYECVESLDLPPAARLPAQPGRDRRLRSAGVQLPDPAPHRPDPHDRRARRHRHR